MQCFFRFQVAGHNFLQTKYVKSLNFAFKVLAEHFKNVWVFRKQCIMRRGGG